MAVVLTCVWVLVVAALGHCHTFSIADDRFLIDNEPFQIISGSVHYSRMHPGEWNDRLQRLRAMGLNTIETYVPWNYHNPKPDEYDFEGSRDVVKFLQMAQANDLYVLLRPGPYVCGEWEFGGFPPFSLAQDPPVTIRTYEPGYITQVDKWWSVLLPKIKPLLIENGGPVLMVQMENEYGSYGNVLQNPADKQYMEHLVSLARQYLGDTAQLYTTDGGSDGYMSRGTLNGSAVLTVGDFGPGSDPTGSFTAATHYNPPGLSPPMCSEFYSGWLTHWTEHQANTSSTGLASALDHLLSINGSVSMYMGFGGTNFGHWSGANGGGGASYQPHITSYDYDSPIGESGVHGFGSDNADKYVAVKEVLLKHHQPQDKPIPDEPPVPQLQAPATIQLTQQAAWTSDTTQAALVSRYLSVSAPGQSEPYGQAYGWTQYSVTLGGDVNGSLGIADVRDRAIVLVNKVEQGVIYRIQATTVPVSARQGDELMLLVENMGRINYGHGMTDPKGILGNVTVDGKPLPTAANWSVAVIELADEEVAKLEFVDVPSPVAQDEPTFYRGSFTATANQSTFVITDGWTKGYIWVNGFNLGRYWKEGPQFALYVPAPVIQASNDIVVLELHTPTSNLTLSFADHHEYHAQTCSPDQSAVVNAAVTLWDQGAYPNNQVWDVVDGQIRLHSDTSLCLGAGPRKDPSTGLPGGQLVVCNSADPTQLWNLESDGTIRNQKTDTCFEITSHEDQEGGSLETYSCNGGANQKWQFEQGQIVSVEASGFAVTVCIF